MRTKTVFAFLLMSIIVFSADYAASFSVVWTRTLKGGAALSLSVADGRAFIVHGDWAKSSKATISAFDGITGDLLWELPDSPLLTDLISDASEVISQYGDYDYPKNGWIIEDNRTYPYLGGLMALDVKTGAVRWRKATPKMPDPKARMAIGDSLLVTDAFRRLYFLKRGDLKQQWTFEPCKKGSDGKLLHPDWNPTGPDVCRVDPAFFGFAHAEGVLYCASSNCMVYAVDTASGVVKKSVNTGGCDNPPDDGALVSNNILYTTTIEGEMNAYTLPGFTRKWTARLNLANAPLAFDGKIISLENVYPYPGTLKENNKISYLEDVFMYTKGRIIAFDQESGRKLWEWFNDSALTVPVLYGGLLFVYSADGNAYGINPETGKTVARIEAGVATEEYKVPGIATDGRTLFVNDGINRLTAIRQ